MNYYKYKMITSSGEIASGVIKLPYSDAMSAITHLERDGATIIYTKKTGLFLTFLINFHSSLTRKKLSRPQQAELLNSLSLMLRAGVNLITALEETAQSTESIDVEDDINDLIDSIRGGAILSEAAMNYPNIFSPTTIHLIKIGEETGNLDAMLKNASEHIKNIHKIVSDTKQALLYPSFVMFSLGLLTLFWFYYVIPKIAGLFKEMDVALPKLTVIIMNISTFVQNNIFLIIIGFSAVIASLYIGRKSSKKARKMMDLMLLKIPVVRTVISASLLAYISEYFSILLNAGLDILSSLTIIQDTITNEVYNEKMALIQDGITKGHGIAGSFEDAGIFPRFVIRMIGIGEISGTLTEQLNHIAEEYQEKLNSIVSTLGKVLEPIVLLISGMLFIIIICGLFLPIYDLIGKIN
jgi:general secretion pathway protein F/type IV pilus assembly protein PilC